MKQDLNFHSVAEVATFPMIVADSNGSVLYQNPSATALLNSRDNLWLVEVCRQLSESDHSPGNTVRVRLRLGSDQVALMEAGVARYQSDGRDLFFFFFIDQREQEATLRKLSGERDRLQIMADQLVHAQETERRHFARELHDGLLQYIIGATMYIDKVRSGGELSLLETAVSRLESATLEGRRLIGELRPPTLDHFGLVATIGELLHSAASESGLTVQSRIEIDESELPDALKSNLFRLVQEATNNMIRHSQATQAELKIWRDDSSLRMCLHDNGKGFEQDYTRGVGLSSMEERASLFGGHCWVESVPGDTSVEVSIPWPHSKQISSSQTRRTDEIAPFYFSRLRQQVEAQLRNPDSNLESLSPAAGDNLNQLLHELQVYRIELEMQNEELRRGRTELECERDRYQELFEHAPVGYLFLSPEFVVCQANLAAGELFETDRENLIGMSLESLVCQWSRDVLKPLLEVGSGQRDVWIRQKVSQSQLRVRLELREGFHGEQSTKLASIYNLRHRPDQPMGGAELEQQVSRLRDGLAPIDPSEMLEEIDLNTEIAVLYDSLRELTGDNLRVLQSPSLPKVLIDVGTLRLVITNLIKNAAESGGKNITLASGHFVSGPKDPQPYVSLDVSDTGFGGNIELLNNLLETFSAGDEACDLRLLETFYLVRRRKGEIRLLSEPGRGTTVRILLPCLPPGGKEVAT